MKNKLTFSIVVPVYNIAIYVKDCIDSILNQTYPFFELILVDDGSTDGSSYICDEYSKKDSRIRVIHKKNGGLVSARKAGAIVANNDLIVCIDGDDFVDFDYLEQINNEYDDSIDVFCTNIRDDNHYIYANECSTGVYDNRYILESFMYDEKKPFPNSGNLVYGIVSKIVRRDIFLKSISSIPDDVSIGEDLLVSTKVFENAKTIYVSNICAYVYRTNDESITHGNFMKTVIRYNVLLPELERAYSNSANKVKCFALDRLLCIVSEIAKSSKNYKMFKSRLESVNYLRELKLYSKKAVCKIKNIKLLIKKRLLSCNLYYFLFLMYKFKKNKR